ncbi:GtrA family protein [Ruegeria sp. HKCCD8929]|uniref:GtrA family protein n=1 Tax=Ruegeria sp. HKCCD8929 TaxID=2683006 RepID=UPI001488A2DF|nr:GtrA family protein [Ruegeria sp. HKCCD8929]
MIAQVIRFCGIGGLATLTHVTVAVLTQSLFGLAPLHANFAGFAGALFLSYLGHSRWTFGVAAYHGLQFSRFVAVALIGLATSSGTVWLFGQMGLGFGASMLCVAVLVPAVTYLALKFWVFDDAEKSAVIDWPGIALSGLLALVILSLFWGRMINHDTAWYLIATRELLGGAELYTDLIEVNPPLNFYFTYPALGLAELFDISDTDGAYLFLSSIIFAVLCWSNNIARKELELSVTRRRLLICGTAVALVLPALNNFGQREHEMVILTLPWLLGELASQRSPIRWQVARAFVAALGICLKPHFLIFPIAVTLYHAFRTRSVQPIFSVANMVILVVGLSYVCFVALVHPNYLSQIVPLAQEIYGAYGAPFQLVLRIILNESVVVLLFALVVVSRHSQTPGFALFLVVALAGLGSYFLQGTGFDYHSIPFRAFATVSFCFVLVQNPRPSAGVVAALLAIVALGVMRVERGFYRNGPALQIAETAQDLGGIDNLVVVTSYVHAGPPAAIASGARWDSRYPANWFVPGALNRLETADCTVAIETCDMLLAFAERNRADNLADIAASKPDLLVFDQNAGYIDDASFSWQKFFSKDPAWPDLLKNYKAVRQTERFTYFQRMHDNKEIGS